MFFETGCYFHFRFNLYSPRIVLPTFVQNKESFRSTLHDSLFHVLTLTDPKLDVGPAMDPQTLTHVLVVHLDLLASMFHVRQSTANPVRENAWDAICKLYAELDSNPGYWTSLRTQLVPLVRVQIEIIYVLVLDALV